MKCEEIKEDLVAFVLNELSAAESEKIGEHLATCDRCKSEVEQYRRTLSALSKWKMPEHGRPASFAFLPAPPMQREDAAPGKSRIKRLRKIAGAAFVMAIVIGLLFTINIQYKNGVLIITIGNPGQRQSGVTGEQIAAVVDSVRSEDMKMVSEMISASERRQADLYRTSLTSLSNRLDQRQRAYISYVMDHMYRLQQQDQIAYYQSRAALDGVVKLANAVK